MSAASTSCMKQRRAIGVLEVEGEAALVAVQVLFVGPWRAPVTEPLDAPGAGGGSILITFAPQSASSRTAVGPARAMVRSRTR